MRHPILEAMERAERGDEPPAELKVVPLSSAKTVADFKHEKPRHRIVCYLAAAGFNAVQIAEQVSYDPVTVRNLLKTPRARQMVAELIDKNFGNELTTLLAGGAVEAVLTLRELCIDAVDERTRVASAKALLEQIRHAPPPPKQTPSSLLDEIEKLNENDGTTESDSSTN